MDEEEASQQDELALLQSTEELGVFVMIEQPLMEICLTFAVVFDDQMDDEDEIE